jgi:hypothetical protein
LIIIKRIVIVGGVGRDQRGSVIHFNRILSLAKKVHKKEKEKTKTDSH